MKQAICLVLLLVLVVCFVTGCEDKNDKAMVESAVRVAGSAEDIRPILVGQSVPELALRTVDGKLFDLNEAIRNKPTVLVFYRGGWCPYCITQLGQLAKIEAEIIKSGYQIIAISPDKSEKLAESINKHSMNYQLLSDSSMAGAKGFGIAFKVDDATIEKYKEYGIDLYSASGERHNLLPVPAIFVVGTDEVIKFEYVNPDYKVRLEADTLLSILKEKQ